MRRPAGESGIKCPQYQPEWANSACILCRSMSFHNSCLFFAKRLPAHGPHHRRAIDPGEFDHGEDCHELDAGFRRICWPLGQPGDIFEAHLQQRRKLRMKNLKGLGRIKLLTVDELSPRARRICAQHDLREFDDELGKHLRSISSCVCPDSSSPCARPLAGWTEAFRDIRTNVLGRGMIQSQFAAKVVGNRNQVGLRPFHNGSRARAPQSQDRKRPLPPPRSGAGGSARSGPGRQSVRRRNWF